MCPLLFMPLGWVVFSRPALLVLLAAAAAGPVLIAHRAGRRGYRVSRLSVTLQSIALTAAALALAGPAAEVGPGQPKPVLVFQDVSASCRDQRDKFVTLPESTPIERLAFADSVAAEAIELAPNRTDASPVLRLAAARASSIAGAVIHTDGRFADDWSAAAAFLADTGVPVIIVPMDSPPPDARIADFIASRRPDGRVELRLTVVANALARRTITVTSGGAATPLLSRSLDLLADQPVTLSLTDRPQAGRACVYRAELSAGDAFAENDSATVATLGVRRRIAVVASPDAGDLAGVISAAAGLEYAEFQAITPTRASADANEWLDYSAVILADAEGKLLARPVREALAAYVRSGGGLVLIGAGPHAGPADRDDPLNQVSALVANPYQRKPLRLIVALDASGSMAESSAMAGRIKFDQAVEAVTSLRRHLTPADSLSVITFSNDANQAYDSSPGPPDFGDLAEALSRVRPGGPTDVGKALLLAARQPVQEGRDGLVLVVSDLRTKKFDPMAMADSFRGRGLSLAVVALSSAGQTDTPEGTPLESLARLLRAPIVAGQRDLSGLAKVFGNLLRRTRGNALRRGSFPAAVVRPGLDLTPGPLPAVGAYLLSAPQPGAEVLAKVSDEHDPLLARRRVGLGRSVSLAMPLAARRTTPWPAGQVTAVAARGVVWAMRPRGDGRFAGRCERRRGRMCVTIEARDGGAGVNGLDLRGRIQPVEAGAGSPSAEFSLNQTAPGRYEGDVEDIAGPIAVEVFVPVAEAADGRVVWQTVMPAQTSREQAAIGCDRAALARLAELTGGRIVASAELDAFARSLDQARLTGLWPVLLGLAIAVMLADWALARVRRRA